MKRDKDYIRKLLFEFEGDNSYAQFITPPLGTSENSIKRWYHVQLLCDDGYLFQVDDLGYRLTSQGHDLIESIRDEGIWKETKKVVAETGGNATIEIVKKLAYGLLKKKISDYSGIEI